jgi:MinD-like ATPase involved in chromosome partitioning or flagellar assembly
MITLTNLLQKTKAASLGKVCLKYSHPSLYLLCITEDFNGLTEEARMELFASKIMLNPSEIVECLSGGTLQIALVTPEEQCAKYSFLDEANTGHHWIEYLSGTTTANKPVAAIEGRPTAIHFYGFKGGQGRSSVLGLLAKQMADDGYRILAVDADLEAPSLDLLLNASASTQYGTLLTYNTPLGQFRPISAYTPRQGQGTVDLIPCRPNGPAYDLDFAAFVLRSSLDVMLPEQMAKNILREAIAQKYDLIFFDHRSGLSTSILPIMSACPGPVAICLRLDEQSSAATGFFEILLRQNVDYPGLFISFSLDPEDTADKLRNRNGNQIETLLKTLAASLALGSLPSNDSGQYELPLTPDELSEYWIPWFHDRSLLCARLPAPSDLQKSNLESLHQFRTVIGFTAKKTPVSAPPISAVSPVLSGSGGADEGLFIETEALRKLLPKNTPNTYIFGRKGTGKTRLLRELAVRRLGEPLVVASDFRAESGIPSSDGAFKDLADSLNNDPEKFWWAILGSALEIPSFPSREKLLASLNGFAERARLNGVNSIKIKDIISLAVQQSSKRVFLIDGIETAFLSSRLLVYLEALFKFLLSLQNDPKFDGKVMVRLFLRTDLARRAFQNVEQQITGRVIYLSWDTQSILNFVLSRIAALPWFTKAFPETVQKIHNQQDILISGNLSVEECDSLLSEVFPQKIRRNNLLTLTFLKTYFSDSASETTTYYPRIYDRFLQLINDPTDLGRQFTNISKLEEGRVSQSLIFAAHERAAKDYLQQVEAELVYLLQLAQDYSKNSHRVKELLQAFAGLPTPFNLDTCVQDLRSKLQGVSEAEIRAALVQMREVGIFEERPGYAGEWRVGRLFKASLGMKYVR